MRRERDDLDGGPQVTGTVVMSGTDDRIVTMHARVVIQMRDREPLERVTGPGGDEWREHLYDLRTEEDVFDHWAYNAVMNGVVDVCQLDGWADVPAETVTFRVGRAA